MCVRRGWVGWVSLSCVGVRIHVSVLLRCVGWHACVSVAVCAGSGDRFIRELIYTIVNYFGSTALSLSLFIHLMRAILGDNSSHCLLHSKCVSGLHRFEMRN